MFWLYACISCLGLLFIVLRVPETKGKDLEEMDPKFIEALTINRWDMGTHVEYLVWYLTVFKTTYESFRLKKYILFTHNSYQMIWKMQYLIYNGERL